MLCFSGEKKNMHVCLLEQIWLFVYYLPINSLVCDKIRFHFVWRVNGPLIRDAQPMFPLMLIQLKNMHHENMAV